MNRPNRAKLLLANVLLSVFIPSGCTAAQDTAHTNEFSPTDVLSIVVDYDGESVTVKKGETPQIVVTESLNQKRKAYFAKIGLSGGALSVAEGARPIGSRVRSQLEIRLPGEYRGSLSIHTTQGRIVSVDALTLTGFYADTTNGSIEIANLAAEQIRLTGANASTWLNDVSGAIHYETKGGSLRMAGASGSGSFEAAGDGDLEMGFHQVTGDIAASAKNGDIALALPRELRFSLKATTKNGAIDTPFPELSPSGGQAVQGTVGGSADVHIELGTTNGTIQVKTA